MPMRGISGVDYRASGLRYRVGPRSNVRFWG